MATTLGAASPSSSSLSSTSTSSATSSSAASTPLAAGPEDNPVSGAAAGGVGGAVAYSVGHVSRLRQSWATHEDGALAQRLQSQEIQAHLGGNRRRNHQIRSDAPLAAREQSIEEEAVLAAAEERRRRLRNAEEEDARLAQRLAQEEDEVAAEQRRYEALRDEVFACRLQAAEKKATQGPSSSSRRPLPLSPPSTPPLPVSADGDVPGAPAAIASGVAGGGAGGATEGGHGGAVAHVRDTSFHNLHGGLRYDDDCYQVKPAKPAMVKAEPVYANNVPEHYAVSNPLAAEVDGAGPASGRGRGGGAEDLPPELLGKKTFNIRTIWRR